MLGKVVVLSVKGASDPIMANRLYVFVNCCSEYQNINDTRLYNAKCLSLYKFPLSEQEEVALNKYRQAPEGGSVGKVEIVCAAWTQW